MAALEAAIQADAERFMDGRVAPGHDDCCGFLS
jgi:hypothetical protein